MNQPCWTKILVLGLVIFWQTIATAVPAEKDWNLLVFLNGKNNLDSYAMMNLKQMEKIGSTANVNILVEWGSLGRKSVERFLVEKDDKNPNVTSPVLEDRGKADMGDWHELVDFAKWAQRTHPARHTFLVIWDHGSGWHDFVPGEHGPLEATDISYDEKTGNSITTEQLGKALGQIAANLGHNIDIYGSDACLMAMAEVADEVASSVDYFVGSQELEPGEGWPYETFLSAWARQPELPAEKIAMMFSREYLRSYQPGGIYPKNDATMSVLDMSQFGVFRKAVSGFADDLRGLSRGNRARAKAAAFASKKFSETDYRDLADYVAQLRKRRVPVPNASKVNEALDRLVLSNDENQGKTTHGLSVWVPVKASQLKEYGKRYNGLQFNRHTGWGTALRSIWR